MSDAEEWHEVNSAYLSGGLTWIRSLLERRLPSTPASDASSAGRWSGIGDTRRALPMADPETLRVDFEHVAEGALAPAAIELFERLDLSVFERDVVLLCAAPELDPAVGTLIGRVQGDSRLSRPTFALALSILREPAWEAIAPEGRLRYWRVVDLDDSLEPLTGRQRFPREGRFWLSGLVGIGLAVAFGLWLHPWLFGVRAFG